MTTSRHIVREWLNSAFWWTLIGGTTLIVIQPRSLRGAAEIWTATTGVGFLASVTLGAWWVDSASRKRARALIKRLHEEGILPPRASSKGD